MQDLWMLLSGNRGEMSEQLGQILEGYTQFCDFDSREVMLLESLRTVRMIHYAAWLARRWSDPAFPRAFSLVRRAPLLGKSHSVTARTDGSNAEGPLALG